MNQSTILNASRSGSVVSIQAGKVKLYGDAAAKRPDEKEWTSAIFKTKIESPIYCAKLGLEGDEQADLKHHGGPDKAVLAYPYEHYGKWREELPEHDWAPGGFGENLTISAFDESSVYIGDVFQIGDVIVQVSEPRQPCYKLARRWGIKELPNLVMKNNRSGWY
ncbi:MOSC domain-containing protein, partial [bacterium]|nr:MOSC domain-containing protein [bacterium]